MTTAQRVIKYGAIALAVFLIIGIFSGIAGFAYGISTLFGDGREENIGPMKTYPVEGTASSLDIRVEAANLIVETGDRLSVESNSDGVSVRLEGGKLRIHEEFRAKHLFSGGATVRVTVPADTVFQTVKLETDAGKVTVDRLHADDITLDLGAGSVDIASLTADRRVKIDGGAGSFRIGSGVLRNASVDMGVGQISVTARFLGKSKLECGIGGCRLNLVGTQDDYSISFEAGIGKGTLDGKTMHDGERYGCGDADLKAEGGIGGLTVCFVDEPTA